MEYFKIYIPQEGFTTNNFGFIRDAKMGLVHYSIVTYPEYNMQKDDDGNEVRHFTGTKGYERNDAVGYGEGAMAQIVNSAIVDEFNNQTGPVDAFRNFHSARVRDPGDFKKDGSWANTTIDKSKGIQLVTGQLKNPPKGHEGSMVAQAYRFPIDKFSPDEAKKWCKAHDIKYIKFTVGKDYKAKSQDYDTAKILVENGLYKTKGNSDGEIIQNGFVMRPVLRAMLSHADVENKSELSELISMIDRKSNSGGIKVELNEAYELVKNSIVNGTVPYTDVAKNCGIDKFIRTENDNKNAEVVKELNSLFGSPADVLAAVKAMKAENESVSKVAVENAVVQAFGAEKIKNGSGEDMDNLSYTRAMELCNGKSGAELKTAIENAAKDPFIMRFRSEQADNMSQINVISGGKTGTEKNSLGIGSGAVHL